MEHSKKFELVKSYWDNLTWNETRLRNAVVKLWITPEEFTEITGIDYGSEDEARTNVRAQ